MILWISLSKLMFVLVSLLLISAIGGVELQPNVIDLDKLINERDPHTELLKLKDSVKRWGFFHIVNHGIDSKFQLNLYEQMKAFFDAPLDIKIAIKRQINNSRGFANDEFTKQRIDSKQIFDVGHKPFHSLPDDAPENVVLDGYNQWLPGSEWTPFRGIVEAYYNECTRLARTLLVFVMESIADSIGHDFKVDDYFGNHTSFLRLNYYPLVAPREVDTTPSGDSMKLEAPLGVHRHTDAGVLTILLQDQAHSALQIYSGSKEDFADGEWVTVDPIPNALTVNIGDMLQVLTNDVLKAPEHRVLASAGTSPRYSAPFFFNPSYDAMIAPLVAREANHKSDQSTLGRAHKQGRGEGEDDDAMQGDGREDGKASQEAEGVGRGDAVPVSPAAEVNIRYRPIRWGDFRLQRFLGDYADRGKEVQIEDFLLHSQA